MTCIMAFPGILLAGILFTVAGIVGAWFINQHFSNSMKRHMDKEMDRRYSKTDDQASAPRG